MSAAAPAVDRSEKKLKPFLAKARRFAKRHPSLDAWLNILEGSVRSGKTWAVLPKIIQLCDYSVAGHRVITGVSKTTIYNNVLSDVFEILGEHNYTYNRQSGELDILGCKWFVVGAKDEGSEKYIRGLTVGVAVADELTLLPVSFIKMLLNRMSVVGARFYGTTNPDTPFHFIFTDLLQNKALRSSGKLFSEHFDLDDNPYNRPGYRQELEMIYPPGSVYHKRFVLGLWVIAEGGIFKDCWSEELLYDDEPWEMSNGQPGRVAPDGLRSPVNYASRYVGIDCGVDHVQVYLDVIDDLKGDVWFDREYWWDSNKTLRQKSDPQYREDLQAFMRGEAVGAYLTDGIGCAKGDACLDAQVILPPECASFEAELNNHGIWHCDADNEVLDGIKHVCSLMTLKKVHFHRKYVANTIKQHGSYIWDPKAKQRGIEQPLKHEDDGPDNVRYVLKTKVAAWRLAA